MSISSRKILFLFAVIGIAALASCRLALFHGAIGMHGMAAQPTGLETFAHHAADCCESDLATADIMNWHDVLMSAPQLQFTAWMVLPLVFTFILFTAIAPPLSLRAHYAWAQRRYRGSPALFNPTLELFQRGILHPKTF